MTRTPLILLLSAAALVLAGCTPTSTPTDTAPDAGGSEEPTTSTATCPEVPQEGYELFTTDLVTAAPEEGFRYDAANPIEFTLSVGAGYTPTLSISYINEAGDAIPEGDYNLLDAGDGTYYQDLGIFDSDANDRPGFASVILTNDGTFTPPTGQESFDASTIGRYCVTFGVE